MFILASIFLLRESLLCLVYYIVGQSLAKFVIQYIIHFTDGRAKKVELTETAPSPQNRNCFYIKNNQSLSPSCRLKSFSRHFNLCNSIYNSQFCHRHPFIQPSATRRQSLKHMYVFRRTAFFKIPRCNFNVG